jgi:hypothetical protein
MVSRKPVASISPVAAGKKNWALTSQRFIQIDPGLLREDAKFSTTTRRIFTTAPGEQVLVLTSQ